MKIRVRLLRSAVRLPGLIATRVMREQNAVPESGGEQFLDGGDQAVVLARSPAKRIELNVESGPNLSVTSKAWLPAAASFQESST